MNDNALKELRLMKISAYLSVIFVIIEIFLAIMVDSMALLLSALYSTIDMVISFIAIFVTRKIHAPPDEKYHYGYTKLEPMMTAINGILILALCLSAIFASIQDIVHPDPVKNLDLVVVYSAINMFFSVAFGIYMRRCGRKWGSQIVFENGSLWLDDALIGMGMVIAFGAGLLLHHIHGYEGYSDYMDPVMCIIISVFLISHPLRVIWNSLLDMLDISPPDEVKTRISGIIAQYCKSEHGLESLVWMRMRKSGRRGFAAICFKVSPDFKAEQMETVRAKMLEELTSDVPQLEFCIIFTCAG